MNADSLDDILIGVEPMSLDIEAPSQTQAENVSEDADIHLLLNEEEEANDVDIDSILKSYGTSEQEVKNAAFGSDFDVSRLIVVASKGHYCKNLATGEWKKFNGVVWENDFKNEHLEYVDNIVRKLVGLVLSKAYSENPKSSLTKHLIILIKTLSSSKSVNSLCELACSGLNGLGVLGETFDMQLRYVGAPNGTIDLETGNLLPGDPDLYITRTLGFPYNPSAKEPEKFLEFLGNIFPCMLPYPKKPNSPIFPSNPDPELLFDPTEFSWENDCENIQKEYDQACADYQDALVQWKFKGSQLVLGVISFIQRLFGYILTGTGREHIFVVFHGAEGRNGKGVLVRTLMTVLGDYGGEVRPELLVRTAVRSSSSPTPDILDLMGKRFVVASETNQGEFFDTGGVKRLTGGDILVGRALYGKCEVRFRPSHTIGLQTNFPPNAPTEDKAFWARLVMITFNRVFVETPDPNNLLEAKINKKLEFELFEEGESILKWLIDGVLHYAKDGLNRPEIIKSAHHEYKERTDLFGDFMDECCCQGSRIRCSEFTLVFNKWCSENGHKPMSRSTISDRMERRGISKIKSDTYFYDNLEWSYLGLDFKNRALRKAGENV